ncbi:MAG: hypothetical protein J6O50_00385 [Ruminiclostridium sp.]|nr:hypothetical protein [Ruminiclostridium sp.]
MVNTTVSEVPPDVVLRYQVTTKQLEESHAMPDVEDCGTDSLPYPTEKNGKKKKILIPELTSMTKYLFDPNLGNQRLALYSFLNKQLRMGWLSRTVGFDVRNRVINSEVCSFTDVTFRKINRENFYADVNVKLILQTDNGTREWDGILECWCSFEGEFTCSVESLTDKRKRRESGYELLNPFLVPYCTNQRMDEIAEEIWVKYGMPEALVCSEARNAYELARRMGLDIQYLPVYDHNGINSIMVFEDTAVRIGNDKTELRPDGTKERITDDEPKTVLVPANTIIVNINVVNKDYSSFNIFHECIHYELHYAFFRLQSMTSNDVRLVNAIEIEEEKAKGYKDPIYFMEKQANRGAYGLMMPAAATRKMIVKERDKAENCRHNGERYEAAGKSMAKTLCLPYFRIRARMIQLGFMEAKGALNFADKKLIKPFAFDIEAWKAEEHTFIIDWKTVDELRRTSKDFQIIMANRRYIYVDGHVVRNEPKYVNCWKNGYTLTEWANAHVDECCLRFVRLYEQTQLGTFVFGRMYYDAEYVKRTLFFLDDLINQQNLDEIDARIEYKHNFPRTFIDAFDMLMRKNGDTRETMAEKLNTTTKTLREWLLEPEKKISADFITVISLMWQLPDWISILLLDRAGIHLNDYDRRHQALSHILHVLWDKGIKAADDFLESMRLDPLRY